MKGSIRPAAQADLVAMKDVIAAAALFPPDLLDAMIAPALSDPATTEIWRVLDDGEVKALGYAAPERMTDGTWNLLLIAVHPDRQGTGLGTRLIAAIEADVAALGARLLLVETSDLPDFAAAHAFYLARGFAEVARIGDYYQAGEGKVIFCKPTGAAAG